jgi:hypothetical protein
MIARLQTPDIPLFLLVLLGVPSCSESSDADGGDPPCAGGECPDQTYDEEGRSRRIIQRDRPLDYAMVSDHAEFLGTVPQRTDPARPAYNHPDCDDFRAGGLPAFAAFGLLPSAPPGSAQYPELCGQDAALCIEVGMDVRQDEIIAAAEAANDCGQPVTVTEDFEECCDLSDQECAAAEVHCSADPLPAGLENCCRPRVPKTIQERAWTSAVWYSP